MASNAYKTYKKTDLLATKVTVTTEPRTLMGMSIINLDDNAIAVKFWNKAAADVAVGTTVPDHTVQIASSGVYDLPPGERGEHFDLGMVIACTKESTTAGTTAPDTSPIIKLYLD